MKLKKYSFFVNEGMEISPEELTDLKSKLVKILDKYKDMIVSHIKWKANQVFYEDFENIDVSEVIKEIQAEIGEDATVIFNVESFLRKIKQILDLKNKTTKRNIRDEFIEYYISLDSRIDTLTNAEEAPEHERVYDDLDGETSVIPRDTYDKEKFGIQVELLKLQEWVVKNKKKVAIVFEGRDSAGKGSTIKRFTEYLNPRQFRVVALGIPTKEEKKDWFGRYERLLPKEGEIVFFDRSWYNRAIVDPAMGYCSEKEYKHFMENVNEWEESMQKDGIILIKFWFSITKQKQLRRFELRKSSPLKYWKFSPNDAKAVDKWDLITSYKNQMLSKTSTPKAPWVIVNSNDKRIGRLNAMRYVLSAIDYDDKDDNICKYYPEVINIIK